MRTPSGTECPHYYQDYYRGRTTQECRLLSKDARSLPWEPRTCAVCPVPAILRANNCAKMVLRARWARKLWRRRVIVEAYCTERTMAVENPYVGCGHCHPEISIFAVDREQGT